MTTPGASPSPSDRYFVGLTYHRAKNAFWLGLFSLFCFGALTGIPAIWVGAQAVSEIRASGGRLIGRGTALLGALLGVIGTLTSAGIVGHEVAQHTACHRVVIHRVDC